MPESASSSSTPLLTAISSTTTTPPPPPLSLGDAAATTSERKQEEEEEQEEGDNVATTTTTAAVDLPADSLIREYAARTLPLDQRHPSLFRSLFPSHLDNMIAVLFVMLLFMLVEKFLRVQWGV